MSDFETVWQRRFLLLLGLVLSVLMHSGSLTWLWVGEAPSLNPTSRPLTVDLIESPAEKELSAKNHEQIVRFAQAPKEMQTEKSKTKRRFLSEEEQAVLEETRAVENGTTVNRGAAAAIPPPQFTKPSRLTNELLQPRKGYKEQIAHLKEEPTEAAGPGEIAVGTGISKGSQSGTGKSFDPRTVVHPQFSGRSTLGDDLPPDIKIGEFTSLSTDRFVYASYYARIEDRVRSHWIRYARAAMQQESGMPPGGWYSQLEIILDREGKFIGTKVIHSSGAASMDNAPHLAFAAARKIPHPPEEMIDSDGKIHLRFGFRVVGYPGLRPQAGP